jgi:hypothetical protein
MSQVYTAEAIMSVTKSMLLYMREYNLFILTQALNNFIRGHSGHSEKRICDACKVSVVAETIDRECVSMKDADNELMMLLLYIHDTPALMSDMSEEAKGMLDMIRRESAPFDRVMFKWYIVSQIDDGQILRSILAKRFLRHDELIRDVSPVTPLLLRSMDCVSEQTSQVGQVSSSEVTQVVESFCAADYPLSVRDEGDNQVTLVPQIKEEVSLFKKQDNTNEAVGSDLNLSESSEDSENTLSPRDFRKMVSKTIPTSYLRRRKTFAPQVGELSSVELSDEEPNNDSKGQTIGGRKQYKNKKIESYEGLPKGKSKQSDEGDYRDYHETQPINDTFIGNENVEYIIQVIFLILSIIQISILVSFQVIDTVYNEMKTLVYGLVNTIKTCL